MALSAVATTSWSSTTMKAAVAVRARTQRWVGLDVIDTGPPLRVCTGTDRPGIENSSLGGDEFGGAAGAGLVAASRRPGWTRGWTRSWTRHSWCATGLR